MTITATPEAPVSEPVPSRGNRYPITAVRTAQTLAAGGWPKAEISRLLARDGIHASERTVAIWVDDEVAARRRKRAEEANRRRSRRAGARPMGNAAATPEFKMARCQALHKAGMPITQIATVMNFDFGDSITRGQLEYALENDRYPMHAKRSAA